MSWVWRFRGRVLRVIDGDTLDVEVDQGFDDCHKERIRLARVNTPELHGESKVRGEYAREWVIRWLASAPPSKWPIVVETEDDTDGFGRYIGVIYRQGDPESLNDALIRAGIATPWPPREGSAHA